ncbi:VanZ family protein [Nitrosococcus wardiae]|uniref:VanZ family protein n=1 Tax=Nitrosococcus wardiae TaxID=1814290 RepID=A0A4P7BYL0_9GAMM|nr:VanZ family protein [Nitrosococcus wardiae]QBQ54427.1 VanZ family protein [Nitrosococcus wardiae]
MFPGKTIEWLTTLALIAIILLVMVGSLLPLQFAGSWTAIKADLQAGWILLTLFDLELDFTTVIQRLLGFIPLGFLVHQKLIYHRYQHAKAVSIGLVTLIALVIELAQAVVSSRHSRIVDFMLAITAGAIGIKFSIPILIHQIFIYPVLDTIRRMLPGFLWLGNYIVACICIAAIIPASTNLSGWNCHYPLLVGNELTYDRPWQGKIRGFSLYPRELTADEIEHLSRLAMTLENAEPRNAAGALALYSFETIAHNRVSSLSREKSPLDLLIGKTKPEKWQLQEDVLHIREPMLIKSAVSAYAICKSIMASQAFTIEAEIASDDLMQSGPARIISNSIDTHHRNFTLGEKKGDLVLRVRTPQNGDNGSDVELQSNGYILAGGWHHVIASYASGVAKLFVDGKEATLPLHYDEALFLGTTMSASTALMTSFLLLGMGIVARIVFRLHSTLKAAVVSVFSTSFFPILISLAIVIWLERHPSPIFWSAAIIMPLLGFVLCWVLQRRLAYSI